ncbi:MAG TPA: hypothetical protein PK765_07070 [bacterium]|nr:hypothetical protein [bacterium]
MVATLASLKIAEAWGAGTKAGNGPNFSVMRKRLVRDEGNPSRLTIVEEPFGLDDSHAFGQNHFALISMLGSYSVLQTLLHVVIGRAADEHLVKPMKK